MPIFPSAGTTPKTSWAAPGHRQIKDVGRKLFWELRKVQPADLEWLASVAASAGYSATLNDNPAVSYDIGQRVSALVASALRSPGILDGLAGGGSFDGWTEPRPDGAAESSGNESAGAVGFLQKMLDAIVDAHMGDSWGYSIDEFLQDVINLLNYLGDNPWASGAAFALVSALGALAAYADAAVLGGAVLNALAFGIGELASQIAGFALAYAMTMAVAILVVVVVVILIIVAISEIVNHWSDIGAFFIDAASMIGEFFTEVWDALVDAAESAWDAVSDVVAEIVAAIVSVFSSDGKKNKGSIIWSSKPPPRPPWGASGIESSAAGGIENVTGWSPVVGEDSWATFEYQVRLRVYQSFHLRYSR